VLTLHNTTKIFISLNRQVKATAGASPSTVVKAAFQWLYHYQKALKINE